MDGGVIGIIVNIVIVLAIVGIIVYFVLKKKKEKKAKLEAEQKEQAIKEEQNALMFPTQKSEAERNVSTYEDICNLEVEYPMQVNINLPEETEQNTATCDEAAKCLVDGDHIQAFNLYYQAAHNGSMRGKFMACWCVMKDDCGEYVQSIGKLDEIMNWSVELHYKDKHPLGLGMSIAYTGIDRGQQVPEDAPADTFLEVMKGFKNDDIFTHILIYHFMSGTFACISPHVYPNENAADIQLARMARFYDWSQKLEKDNVWVYKELDNILLLTSTPVVGMSHSAILLSDKYGKTEGTRVCFEKALTYGDSYHYIELANYYIDGVGGVKVDLDKAESLLKQAMALYDTDQDDMDYCLITWEALNKRRQAIAEVQDIANRKIKTWDWQEVLLGLEQWSEEVNAKRAEEEAQKAAEEASYSASGYIEEDSSGNKWFVDDRGNRNRISSYDERNKTAKIDIGATRALINGTDPVFEVKIKEKK